MVAGARPRRGFHHAGVGRVVELGRAKSLGCGTGQGVAGRAGSARQPDCLG